MDVREERRKLWLSGEKLLKVWIGEWTPRNQILVLWKE